MAAPAIGIDLGTCFSCVGVFENDAVKIIPNDQGSPTTPSFVAFTETGRLIGETAKDQLEMNGDSTIFDAKRLVGRMYWDPVVQSNLNNWPFEVICDGKGRPKLCVKYKGETKWLYPEEVVAMTLLKMKETAEAYLKKEVTDAVISIPAHFNSYQREAVRNAGKIAGLNVLRVTSETTLAAFAYGYQKSKMRGNSPCSVGEQIVLILDVGGGSVGVSIVGFDDNYFEVKATVGDPCVGGQDMNTNMVTFLANMYDSKYYKDITADKHALLRLRTASERTKRLLSIITETSITIKNFCSASVFGAKFSRARFEKLNHDLFCSVLAPIEKALQDAKLNKSDVKDIVLLGGCSRIPRIKELVQDYFNGMPLNLSFDADTTVAQGAAIQAALLSGDPKVPDIFFSDRTYFSLGVKDAAGKLTKLIERNSALGSKCCQTFVCAPDSSGSVSFQIFEGEGTVTTDNIYLGKITLTGLPSSEQEIKITFEIDENRVLSVFAISAFTGVQEKVVIYCGLSEQEMAQLRIQGEKYKSDDKEEQERRLAKEQLLNYCANVQVALLKEENLRGEDRSIVLDSVRSALEWLEENGRKGKEAYQEKLQALSAVSSIIISTTPFP